MEFKLRYSNFWPGLNAETILFTRIIESLLEQKVHVVSSKFEKADLEITSVFHFKSKVVQIYQKGLSGFSEARKWDYLSRAGRGFKSKYPTNSRKVIWYTGENLRAPMGIFDGTIGFDATSEIANNLFYPYWMLRLDWGFGEDEFEIKPNPELMTQVRKAEKRQINVCSFSNRKETIRENLVKLVSSKLNVDKFGQANGISVASKSMKMKNYGLQICSENDLYPNYVTEKIPEAWYGRNVPIWKGLDSYEFFNKEAMYDFTNLNHEQISQKVNEINLDEVMYKQTLPILNRTPDLFPLINFISKVL